MKTKKKISILVLFAFLNCLNYGAFAQGMKIVSPHPDLKFKITRCEAAGNNVIIDYVIENLNTKDIDFHIASGDDYGIGDFSTAYDDEGNMYGKGKIKVNCGNSNLISTGFLDTKIPSEIPVKGKIQIEGIPESASLFKRLDLRAYSDDLGLDWRESKIRITNLPIYREGDE